MGRGRHRDRQGARAGPCRGDGRAWGARSARLTPPRIAIIGAGVGGLAAANRLLELARERSTPIELVVLEASARAGGVVGTELVAGALLERGADTLVTHKPAAIELCRRLGLGDRLVAAPSGTTEIVQGGALLPVPDAFALLAPTRPESLLRSRLLTESGARRALGEPDVPAKSPVKEDESVGSFVRRRYGDELLERIVEPIVGAIHMADVDRLSLQATFPRFAALEAEHGSVTAGLAVAAAARGRASAPAAMTLEGGLGRLVEALVARLPPGALRTCATVEVVRRTATGFRLTLSSGESAETDSVILATPAPASAALLRELDPALAASIGAIDFATAVTVHVAWPAASAPPGWKSLGFFVPRGAGLALVAATAVTVKFPDRVPEGLFLVRAFLGGKARRDVDSHSDVELAATAIPELAAILRIRAEPGWTKIVRHPGSMPQPAVGHPALAARIREHLTAVDGLELAGGPLGAYGLPDAVSAAEAAAERLLSRPRGSGGR